MEQLIGRNATKNVLMRFLMIIFYFSSKSPGIDFEINENHYKKI